MTLVATVPRREAAAVRGGRRRLVTAVLTCWMLLATALAMADLPAAVARVIKRHSIPQTGISIVVQAIDEQAPLLTLNADTPRNPASAIKLVTTFVALDLLGPTYTWPTEVYALGPITGEVLKGDLLFKGHGDPHLVIEELWRLLGALRRQGVRTVTGDIVIDDSHFDVRDTDPGAFDKQPYRLYNTLPNAFLVNFESVEFDFAPAGNNRVAIRASPALPNLTIINKVTATPGPCRNETTQIIMHAPQPEQVAFSGTLPEGCRGYSLSRRVMAPAPYAYGLIRVLWAQWGGEIGGTLRMEPAPAKRRPLLVWQSKPLAELIRSVNKWSNNVMTRMLLFTLATTKFDPPVTREQGVAVIEHYLNDHGIPTAGLVIDNGAGLSRKTRISATQMTALLRHAYASPFMPEFVASMSMAGLDGTMRKRFRGKPEAGNMHIKTGSLNNTVTIAGYVHAKSGKRYSVVLGIEHPNIQYGSGSQVQDALLSWVYGQH